MIFYLFIFFLFVTTNLYAQTPSDIHSYIIKYKDIALQNERDYGIPATITLAQGLLESAAGKNILTKEANNHFGVKAGPSWKGDIYLAWDDEIEKSKFRKYKTSNESFKDHALVLKGKRYETLFAISLYDYRSWAYGLQKAGYATAPNYAQALIGYIDAYKLYTINGGVKLKPGKIITIKRYITKERPQIDQDDQINEDTQTEEELIIKKALSKYVVEINDVRCTLLYPGESLESISRKYNIQKKKLLEYNEIGNDSLLKEGDIIFLEKKKTKFNGSRDFYKIKDGDTLYSISQQFGIKIANLSKLNNLNLFTELKVGQSLKLK